MIFVFDVRTVVAYAGCKEHGSRSDQSRRTVKCEANAVHSKALDPSVCDRGIVRARLTFHPAEQGSARDAARKTGMIVRLWNERRSALTSVDDDGTEMKARQVNRRSEPSGSAPDDDTIEHVSVPLHDIDNAAEPHPFPRTDGRYAGSEFDPV